MSTNGGQAPAWSKQERQLMFKGPDGLMAVPYSADAAVFNAGRPQLWAGSKSDLFALAPDRKRVAIVENENSGKTEISQIELLTGFLDELRRRVPARPR